MSFRKAQVDCPVSSVSHSHTCCVPNVETTCGGGILLEEVIKVLMSTEGIVWVCNVFIHRVHTLKAQSLGQASTERDQSS